MNDQQDQSNGSSTVAQFVGKHWESFVVILSSLVAIGVTYGILRTELSYTKEAIVDVRTEEQADIAAIQNRLDRIEKDGTGLSHSNKWVLEQHAKEIVEIKADNRRIIDNLNDMKTDLRLIASWVKE